MFSEGETRPSKPKKTKATKGAQPPPANKKRTVSSAELDVSQHEKNGMAKRLHTAGALSFEASRIGCTTIEEETDHLSQNTPDSAAKRRQSASGLANGTSGTGP